LVALAAVISSVSLFDAASLNAVGELPGVWPDNAVIEANIKALQRKR